VAGQAMSFRRTATTVPVAHPALINGVAGMVSTVDGELISVSCFTVADGKIAEIHILSDRDRLSRLELTGFA
jgi:RNA polymerase sigma-70 factor (ECF subfamily)